MQADEAGDGHRGERDSIATSGIRVGSVPVTSDGAKMLATAVVAQTAVTLSTKPPAPLRAAPSQSPARPAIRTYPVATAAHSQPRAPTNGKCSCWLPVTRSGENNAAARVASQIAATPMPGAQVSR